MGKIANKLQYGFIKYHVCGVTHRNGENFLITKKTRVVNQF